MAMLFEKRAILWVLILFVYLEATSAAQSCPTQCTCISNSLNRPDIETTVVDCSYQKFMAFPTELPFSTTELSMQVWAF